LDTTVPFRFPIQMVLSLPFQNGEKVIFTAETSNGTVPFLPNRALHFPFPLWIERDTDRHKYPHSPGYLTRIPCCTALLRATLRYCTISTTAYTSTIEGFHQLVNKSIISFSFHPGIGSMYPEPDNKECKHSYDNEKKTILRVNDFAITREKEKLVTKLDNRSRNRKNREKRKFSSYPHRSADRLSLSNFHHSPTLVILDIVRQLAFCLSYPHATMELSLYLHLVLPHQFPFHKYRALQQPN